MCLNSKNFLKCCAVLLYFFYMLLLRDVTFYMISLNITFTYLFKKKILVIVLNDHFLFKNENDKLVNNLFYFIVTIQYKLEVNIFRYFNCIIDFIFLFYIYFEFFPHSFFWISNFYFQRKGKRNEKLIYCLLIFYFFFSFDLFQNLFFLQYFKNKRF